MEKAIHHVEIVDSSSSTQSVSLAALLPGGLKLGRRFAEWSVVVLLAPEQNAPWRGRIRRTWIRDCPQLNGWKNDGQSWPEMAPDRFHAEVGD